MVSPISIPQLLHRPGGCEAVEFKVLLPDLKTLTPVQASVQVTHKDSFLEVVGEAETIVTLVCDRCLAQYNHRLSFETTELLWFSEGSDESKAEIPFEEDLELDEMVETISKNGFFDPSEWVYEQLCLEMPYKNICGETCEGIPQVSPENAQPEGDRRWAILESLKGQLPS
jgi:uncharacterized protein